MKSCSRGVPPTPSSAVLARIAELEQLGAAGGPDAIERLLEGLHDDDANIREAAVRALVQTGPGNVLERLRAMPRSGSQWKTVARILGLLGTAESCELLGAALFEGDREVRIAASLALVDAGEASVPVLVRALKHEEPDIRSRAAMSLGRIKAKSGVEALMEACSDEAEEVRLEAVLALAAIRDERAVTVLEAARDDPAEAVRQSAPIALGEIGTPKAREALKRCLECADEMVRWIAQSELEAAAQ